MNISVYFYDENGKYTHMDMTPIEFNDDGVQIIPENSTLLYPPNLATDPYFSVELGKWVPQVAVEPIDSEDLKNQIDAMKKDFELFKTQVKEDISGVPELASTVQSQGKRISKVDSELIHTNYYLGVAFPNVKHFFTYS